MESSNGMQASECGPLCVNQGPLAQIAGQIMAQIGPYGACDPTFKESYLALSTYVFSTCVFKLTRVAPGVGGSAADLTIAANTGEDLFVAGVGEIGAAQGLPGNMLMDESMTNALENGAPVERDQMYVIVGLTARFLAPWAIDPQGPATPTELRFNTSFLPGDLDAEILKAFYDNTFLHMYFGQNVYNYRLGSPAHWPAMGGPTGGSAAINNGRPTAGVFLPFRAASVITVRDESRKLRIRASVNTSQSLRIVGNAAAADITSDLYLPLQVQLLGYPICNRDVQACGLPGSQMGVDGALIDQLIQQRLAAMLASK